MTAPQRPLNRRHPRTVPGAPTIVGNTVAGSNLQLSAAFTAPTSDGGSAILSYDYSTDAGATWRSAATTTSPIIITTLSVDGTTPLVNATTYFVELRAVNTIGIGTGVCGCHRHHADRSLRADDRKRHARPVVAHRGHYARIERRCGDHQLPVPARIVGLDRHRNVRQQLPDQRPDERKPPTASRCVPSMCRATARRPARSQELHGQRPDSRRFLA